MRRDDVDISYHNGTRGRPMVNVKVHGQWDLLSLAEKHRADFPDTRFVGWLESDRAKRSMDAAWESACEQGYEQAEQDAQEVFDFNTVKCWTAGRSGGWLVVEGLPDVDTWDAIMLGKWARFAKMARALADDVPYLMLDFLYHNAFVHDMDALGGIVPPAA